MRPQAASRHSQLVGKIDRHETLLDVSISKGAIKAQLLQQKKRSVCTMRSETLWPQRSWPSQAHANVWPDLKRVTEKLS